MTVSDRELMRYHDGELSPRAASLVRARLAADPAARERLRALSQLSSLMRLWAQEKGPELDLTDGILRRIADVGNRGSHPVRSKRGPALAGAFVAVAAAAALLLLLGPHGDRTESGATARSSAAQGSASPGVVEGERASLTPNVAVEAVDFGERSGSIFVVGSGASETTVIWLAEPVEAGGRMEPL